MTRVIVVVGATELTDVKLASTVASSGMSGFRNGDVVGVMLDCGGPEEAANKDTLSLYDPSIAKLTFYRDGFPINGLPPDPFTAY